MILYAYPGRAFANSDFGGFIPHIGVDRFAKALIEWKENLSRFIDLVELKKGDNNISPNRYIPTGDTETYRPLTEIIAEMHVIKAEARETDKALRKILERVGM